MDELPRAASTFLDATRDVHDPPDRLAARERVYVRLMAALAAPTGRDAISRERGSPWRAGRRTFGWASFGKLMLATVVISLTSSCVRSESTPARMNDRRDLAHVPSSAVTARPEFPCDL